MSAELIILIVGVVIVAFALFINKYAEPLDHNHRKDERHAH